MELVVEIVVALIVYDILKSAWSSFNDRRATYQIRIKKYFKKLKRK